jgi:3-oxoacyl-[acyl-carrier-protein] synthase-3
MGYIVSTGSYLPGQEPVTNKMLAEIFGESMNLAGDYFGVTSRNFAVDYRTGENIGNEYNSDFCYKAVKEALRKAQLSPEKIGLLITATNTPDYALPQMSVLIQEKMGFRDLITFDLRGGCSAPLQGIFIADRFIKNGVVENAMVVGSEDFSGTYYHCLLKNKNNYLVKDLMSSLIFGDGAAAVVVSKNKIGQHSLDIEDIVSQSSFADWPSGFIVSLSGSKIRHLGAADISLCQMMKHFPKEIETYLPKVTKTVFEKIYAKRNYIPEDFKYIVGPQANPRLVDYLNKKFNINNYFYNGDVTGNIPGGALLLALDKLLQQNHLAQKDKILILGVESSKWLYGYCILNKA